jgi:filamentous hemagglutinin
MVLTDQKLLDEFFEKKTTALSPAFTMVLTIALTSGFGNLIGSSMQGTALATNTGQLTHLGKAVASAAASTTVGVANGAVSGELDLGAILRGALLSAGTSFLTSSLNLKAADPAQAEAFANNGNAAFALADDLGTRPLFGSTWGAGFTKPWLGVGTQLTTAGVLEGAFDATLSAGVQTAANGGNFGDAFKGSFINSVVALGLADVQTGIGDIFKDGKNGGEGSFGHVMLHAMAGCVAAEAQGADCGSGAAGGIAGAVYSGSLNGTALSDVQQRKKIELIGLAVGWMFSAGKAENVSTASTIATSAVVNNRQLHRQEGELIRENAAGFARANGISIEQAIALLTAAALDQVDAMFYVTDRGPKFLAAVAYLDRLGRGSAIPGTTQRPCCTEL